MSPHQFWGVLPVSLSTQQNNIPGCSRICNTTYYLTDKMSGNYSALCFCPNNEFGRFISRFTGTSRCLNCSHLCSNTWIRDPSGTFSLGKNALHSPKNRISVKQRSVLWLYDCFRALSRSSPRWARAASEWHMRKHKTPMFKFWFNLIWYLIILLSRKSIHQVLLNCDIF